MTRRGLEAHAGVTQGERGVFGVGVFCSWCQAIIPLYYHTLSCCTPGDRQAVPAVGTRAAPEPRALDRVGLACRTLKTTKLIGGIE